MVCVAPVTLVIVVSTRAPSSKSSRSPKPIAGRKPASGRSTPSGRRKVADAGVDVTLSNLPSRKELKEADRRRVSSEAIGLVLMVCSVLLALALWFEALGPVGESLNLGLAGVLGLPILALPVLVGGVGVGIAFGWRDLRPRSAFVGALLMTVAVAGMCHLARSVPENWTWDQIRGGGGLVGLGLGGLLRDLLSIYGASVVLVALAVVGFLFLTGITSGQLARSMRACVVAIGKFGDRTMASAAKGGGTFATKLAVAWQRSRNRGRPELFDQDTLGEFVTEDPKGPAGSPVSAAPAASGDVPFDAVANPAAHDSAGRVSKAGHRRVGARQPSTDPTNPSTSDPNASAGSGLAPGTAGSGVKADRPALTVHVPEAPKATKGEQLSIDLGPGAEGTPWKLPPLKLLERGGAQTIDRAAIEARGRALEEALASHGVTTTLVGMTVGPQVTRYELELGSGVKVAQVVNLSRDIAYAMASPDVRLQAPIPGRSAVGVEVPNLQRQVVHVGDVLASEEAHRAAHPLTIALGRDISGRPVLMNLATTPHLLIAGATGAGKSSCINSLLTSLLVRSTPEQVRLILVDPKQVEMGQYNGLPHLLTQVVTNPKKAANALSWAVTEMERRYDLLYKVSVRDITGYNASYDAGELNKPDPVTGEISEQYQRLPYIVVVVDEMADLMMVAGKDVEDSINRIAAKARAVGIHLVLATQRPSVNVITGVIKANVPARIAFTVSSLQDSRVIIDHPGAEKLIGKGDMLVDDPREFGLHRVQGAWVTEKEVKAVVGNWKRQVAALTEAAGGDSAAVVTKVEEEAITGGPDPVSLAAALPGGDADDDDAELLDKAMEIVVRSQLGSTSMLQRKLRVGFARAGRIMDLLEQKGVVGPSEGSKARAVLMTAAELDGLMGGHGGIHQEESNEFAAF